MGGDIEQQQDAPVRAADGQLVVADVVPATRLERGEEGRLEGRGRVGAGHQRDGRHADEQQPPARAVDRVVLVAAAEALDPPGGELGIGVLVVGDGRQGPVDRVRREDPLGALELADAAFDRGVGGALRRGAAGDGEQEDRADRAESTMTHGGRRVTATATCWRRTGRTAARSDRPPRRSGRGRSARRSPRPR